MTIAQGGQKELSLQAKRIRFCLLTKLHLTWRHRGIYIYPFEWLGRILLYRYQIKEVIGMSPQCQDGGKFVSIGKGVTTEPPIVLRLVSPRKWWIKEALKRFICVKTTVTRLRR